VNFQLVETTCAWYAFYAVS